MCTQGQSFIQDRNTQFNFSPSITLVRDITPPNSARNSSSGVTIMRKPTSQRRVRFLRLWAILLLTLQLADFLLASG